MRGSRREREIFKIVQEGDYGVSCGVEKFGTAETEFIKKWRTPDIRCLNWWDRF